jgi:sigma-B regulation protein RsbU (phosphoserine phosphatase)
MAVGPDLRGGARVRDDEEARLAAVRRYDILDTPPDGAFDRVTAVASRTFGVPIAIVSIVDRDRIWFKSHHGLDVPQIDRDPGLCASAILQDGPWVVEDAALDPRTLANPLVAGDFGLRFYAGVPLETRDGHNLGTLCLLDYEPRQLTEDETATLEDLAAVVMDQLELRLNARTAVAREHALRDQAEATARALQGSLLPPQLPQLPATDIAALYRPADASQVGGDFYDVFEVGADCWAVVIGDVSGKGPAAAAVTALARHTIRTAALITADPAEILGILNRAMLVGSHGREIEHFCTVHVSFLRPRDGGGFSVRTAAAGHPPALLMRPGAAPEPIATHGPPVGWHDTPAFTVTETDVPPGSVLLAYTDGLSEARRGTGFLGEETLAAALTETRGAPASATTDHLLDILAATDVRARDDAAAIVLRVGLA